MAYITRHSQHVRYAVPSPLALLRSMRQHVIRSARRREIASLLEQDERVLDDMGITRGDVIEALSTKGDASQVLRTLAARRRFWTRSRERL